jgi:hypothetical protein
MLGLGLQATLRPKAEGAARPVQDGLVLADNFRKSPVNDELGLTFPSNGSAVFNGTSDYIQLPDPFSLTNHTIAAWVYNNTTSGSQTVFDNRDANDDGVRILGSSGTFFYQLNASDRAFTMPTAGNWYFITATYDGTTQKLYADGSLVSSVATSQTISVSDYGGRIGRSTYENNYMNGNLANVAIWNRALTSDEINSVMWKQYEEISTSERNGLQAWYSLDSVDTFADWYTYAQNQGAVIEGRTCVDNALNALAQL